MKTLPLIDRSGADPYVAYSYSYPHKSAYGPFEPPVDLEPVWQAEQRDALFLYIHIPFCEMRCGFCNLFTQANASPDFIQAYLHSLERQANRIADLLGEAAFSRFAIGGGTPTVLNAAQLDRVFEFVEKRFGLLPSRVPTSVEVSPQTVNAERMRVLRDRGVERVSMGVQSFVDEESHRIGRPQKRRVVEQALALLEGFPIVNLDLIYGQPEQTLASWEHSLRSALEHEPEELFLYPLYVRPQTGAARRGNVQRAQAESTLAMYRLGRDLLTNTGYEQISMRCFRRLGTFSNEGPTYCCQRDGMVGLGAGARSYTRDMHYSTRFAVEADGVQRILADWIGLSDEQMGMAHWGIRLTDEDRKRRFVIQSLLQKSGLADEAYRTEFASAIEEDFPILMPWIDQGLVIHESNRWGLSAAGLERSDFLGPALYSQARLLELQEFSQC